MPSLPPLPPSSHIAEAVSNRGEVSELREGHLKLLLIWSQLLLWLFLLLSLATCSSSLPSLFSTPSISSTTLTSL